MPSTVETIRAAVDRLGPGPLTEDGLRAHIFPLFSRVLARREIYLANHSLGRPLDALADDMAEFTAHWYADMDGAWGPWLAERRAHRARIARLIGRGRPDGVVPKTSAAQGLRAVLHALPNPRPTVVATRGEFDSIDIVLKTFAHKGRARVRWVDPDGGGVFHEEQILDACARGADLLVVSQVLFATGQLLAGLGELVRRTHERGVLVLVDTYHSAGVVPVGFDELDADFAIGGNYKYTRGGPGACWLAVADRHLRAAGVPEAGGLFTLDTGWFAKREPFAYVRTEEPDLAAGGDAWLEATEPVAVYYQSRSGLELTLALGVDRLRAYSLEQQGFLRERLRERGVEVAEIGAHGAFTLVPISGPGVVAELKAAGVNADARPGLSGSGAGRWMLRLCPDMLTTRAELSDAAGRVARLTRGTRVVSP
jgi:kynureninase